MSNIVFSGRTSAYTHKDERWYKDKPEYLNSDGSINWHSIPHEASPALQRKLVLDAQWTDCPIEIENEVKKLWRFHELGNDNYILRYSINNLLEFNDQDFEVEEWFWGETEEEKKGWVKVPLKIKALIDYLRSKDIPDDEEVIIHWWW